MFFITPPLISSFNLAEVSQCLNNDGINANGLSTAVSGTTLGEGTLVRFVTFILDAHYSNVGKKKPPKKPGELVNCNNPDKESNDIHYAGTTVVGNDWWIHVDSSPLRVVSQVCAYDPSGGMPFWYCTGSASNPFPR